MASSPSILIIGAGPTGLGAAWRLQELGHTQWQLAEASQDVGGLACSVIDPQGFTWDRGGHVLFSHYPYFDRLMDELLKDQWVEHVRESWVYMRERFIAYPLQNNIWRLPFTEWLDCLSGLVWATVKQPAAAAPATFKEWMQCNFGSGIVKAFLGPYNWKVWAYPPERLDASWVQERVATVHLGKILRNALLRHEEKSWGPNARFRFPLRGGTGAIWKALYGRLDPARLSLGKTLAAVSIRDRKAFFSDGTSAAYDYLLSTIPLDTLLRTLKDQNALAREADRLVYSGTHLVGVGLKGKAPEKLSTKCWMYFPEPDVPFYRVTVFSNYSPFNVPQTGEHWSLLCETSESPVKPVQSDTIVEEVLAGLKKVGFISRTPDIASLWHERLEHGYPTPFTDRDRLLDRIDQELMSGHIWSRGRFGGWKYEASNQDHSLMQGVEFVDHVLLGKEEKTYQSPGMVNKGRAASSPDLSGKVTKK